MKLEERTASTEQSEDESGVTILEDKADNKVLFTNQLIKKLLINDTDHENALTTQTTKRTDTVEKIKRPLFKG